MRRPYYATLAAGFALAGCAHEPEPTLRERFGSIAQHADVMRQCSERVWSGYSWAGKQLVFYERATRTARYYRVSADSKRAESGELSYESLPEAALHGAYESATFEQTPTLFVSLDDNEARRRYLNEAGIELGVDAVLPLALHEAFHIFGQADWTKDEEGQRASDFPLRWQPRYLRLQLLRALQAAIRGEGSLGAAKYWSDRYQAEHQEEAASVVVTDLLEGSAKYVEVVSVWLAREGCELTEVELQTIAGEEIDTLAGYFPLKSFESYALGAASGVLLRARGPADWQARVALGEAPTDILLEDVVAEAQPEDQARVERVRTFLAGRNEELEQKLEPFIAAATAPDSVRIAIPLSWGAGSFDTSEALRLVEVAGQPIVFPDFQGSFIGDDGERIEIGGLTVLDSPSAPCPTNFVLVLPAETVTTLPDGTYRVSAEGVSATPVRGAKRELDGVQWLCLGED